MLNQRFGKLLVVARAGSQNRKRLWLCKCDCGGETITTTGNLNSGNSKSCGCEQRDAWRRAPRFHGKRQTRAYSSWANMWTRCTNRSTDKFKNWGGRGITVCDRWQSFENFYADMGDPPDGMTLDRIDNDGNYEPPNCRWADAFMQARNKQRHRVKQCG